MNLRRVEILLLFRNYLNRARDSERVKTIEQEKKQNINAANFKFVDFNSVNNYT